MVVNLPAKSSVWEQSTSPQFPVVLPELWTWAENFLTQKFSGKMVNFMCHLYLSRGCQDIWPNIILGVSAGVFLDEINILIISRVKQIVLYNIGRPHRIS